MISVIQAKKIIQENSILPKTSELPLPEVAGMVLAEDVYAATDIPLYPQSSMDGYALSYSGWQQYRHLKIKGEIPAGSNETFTLDEHHAIRIFTGAAVPPGADTVVMQEKTKLDSSAGSADELIIEDENIRPGNNIRPRGSEIKAGSIALTKGTYLSPAAVGFLAGIGIANVHVYQKPSITIIVTGRELQQPGKPLQYGQVYESNSFSLVAALRQLHIGNVKVVWADDDLEIMKTILADALEQSNVVLLTGGVSAGDYDLVVPAAAASGVSPLFHKVKQRPGKPLYFGRKEDKLVFGLPGNPSSVLTCFYEYVIPALETLSNMPKISRELPSQLFSFG